MDVFYKQYERVRRTGKLVPESEWFSILVATKSFPPSEQRYFRNMMKWAATAGYNSEVSTV
jgi:hypothetical protein